MKPHQSHEITMEALSVVVAFSSKVSTLVGCLLRLRLCMRGLTSHYKILFLCTSSFLRVVCIFLLVAGSLSLPLSIKYRNIYI
ncbi:hypothetical protein F4859DRAFT_465687 [Xylaria cf. heliscus]|nr:hypothetical protein F4859DRAFT_465687 [Xylaria cf. heliscus]